MSTYVTVNAEDLQISDLVKGRGRLARDVEEHTKLEGFVVAVFERRGVESVLILRADAEMQVRLIDE